MDRFADSIQNVTMPDLRPETLTWTALLARWIEFAQAAVAIPEEENGERWRASVPAMINLQAVTLALRELDTVDQREWPWARDKAEVLIERSASELGEAWRAEPMPGTVLELCDDARSALAASVYVGAIELRWPGPGVLTMPGLPDVEQVVGAAESDDGTWLAVVQPGTLVMPDEPVAWWLNHAGVNVDGCLAEPRYPPRQVYRQIDDDGRITGDVVTSILSDPIAGLPLLVPLVADGATIGQFTVDADEWESQQRAMMMDAFIAVVEEGA